MPDPAARELCFLIRPFGRQPVEDDFDAVYAQVIAPVVSALLVGRAVNLQERSDP